MLLLGENSSSFRLMVEKVLGQICPGAPLIVAHDGMEVLEYFEDASKPIPCAVLVDFGQTSFEVLRWLRAQPRLKSLPVLLWSSYYHSKDAVLARQIGATEFLEKPQTYGEMLHELRRLMGIYGKQEVSKPAPEPGSS
jgi:DNA-binding response OmpR family regulator